MKWRECVQERADGFRVKRRGKTKRREKDEREEAARWGEGGQTNLPCTNIQPHMGTRTCVHVYMLHITHWTNLPWIRRLCLWVSWNVFCCTPTTATTHPPPSPNTVLWCSLRVWMLHLHGSNYISTALCFPTKHAIQGPVPQTPPPLARCCPVDRKACRQSIRLKKKSTSYIWHCQDASTAPNSLSLLSV